MTNGVRWGVEFVKRKLGPDGKEMNVELVINHIVISGTVVRPEWLEGVLYNLLNMATRMLSYLCNTQSSNRNNSHIVIACC